MSELSTAECAAGISRRALETLSSNGNGHRTPRRRPDAPGTLEDPPASTAQEPTPELTHVLLFHDRQLDLINRTGWRFELRSTAWHLGGCHTTYVHMTRPELEKLHQTIGRVLEIAGPARAEE